MQSFAETLAQADSHRKAGRLQQAETIYRGLVTDDPANADSWVILGAFYRDQQRFPDAVAAYRKAIEAQPDKAQIHNSLGITFACWRRFTDAEGCFQKALELQPDYAKALNNLGNTLSELRKLDEAEAAYRRAAEMGFADASLHDSLGHVLARKGDLEGADQCYRRALSERPDDSVLLAKLSVVAARQGRIDEAAELMRRSLRKPAPDADVWFRLGDALSDKGKLDLAILCFERVLAILPHDHTTLNHLATALLQQGRLEEATTHFRRAIAVKAGDQWSRSSLLFLRTNVAGIEPEDLFEEHLVWARLHAVQPKTPPTFENDRNPDRKLKIGYVSPDFRRHPVGRFMESVLAAHDPNRVEVYCYDEQVRGPDEVTDRLRAAAQHWRITKDKSHDDVARMIRADGVDIAIDLAGHTGHNRIGAFALRPAPVQVTYLGYPNTTGLGAIDYVLVDSVTQPASEPAWFVEEPVRLGGGFCSYAPRDDAMEPPPLPALKNGYVTFGAFHNLSKLNGVVLDRWAKVLDAVPGSKLRVGRNTLSGETRAELEKRFAAHGIGADRLELRQLIAGPAAFLEAYCDVDITLDTFPWTGHTTACDSLWMGVPVVTLRGQTHAGRMVASVLTHVGLTDWIAESLEGFVEVAARHAQDLPRLAALRAELRDRMRKSKLCDAKNFTHHLEESFRLMWKRWCARGPEPASIHEAMARADALRQQNRLWAAEDLHRWVVRTDPYYTDSWAWLGSICQSLNRLEEATAHYKRAIHLRPQDPRSHNSLGIVYARMLRFTEAEACFRRAIEWNPDYAKAFNNLGNSLSEQGKLDEAAAAFLQADRLGYHDATLMCNLASVYSRQGFRDRAVESFRAALQLDPNHPSAGSAILFMQNYDPEANREKVFEEHERWGAARVSASATFTHSNNRDADRPLRVGYVSPDFRNHPVGRFIEPVLQSHDSSRVQAYCYDEAPFPPDTITQRLRRQSPRWIITRGQTDVQFADRVRADQIDILVDLAGHTAHNRLDVFARKPAPVQITYLGYPNTTGLTTIDYILVDDVTFPPDATQRFTEIPVRLPGGFSCFAPRPEAPAVNELPASKTGSVTFGSTHGLIKLNGAVLDLWAEVLRAVPTSRLRIVRDMLTGEAREKFQSEFRRRGIPDRQLDLFQPPVGHADYWTVYHDIDIALDAFPWTGHTTACEALWMGVPVVTLRGPTHAGRMVSSVLTQAGCADWIADDRQGYVELAASRAGNLQDLASLRAGLRNQLHASPLCDVVGFTRRLEEAYRSLWHTWCRGA